MPAVLEQDDALERRTREIGRELFARSQALAPGMLNPRWWEEHLMQWSMNAGGLKGRLFRLVDVLPALAGRDQVHEHLKEYLGDPGGDAPRWIRLAPALLGAAHSAMARFSSAAVLRAVRRLARRFIAGGTADEAVETILALRRRRLTFSLDLLGEKVLSEPEADDYARRYCELIESLTARAAGWPGDPLLDAADGGRAISRVNLSIKLTSLYSQFDPIAPRRSADEVVARLAPILRLARRRGAFIHFDMEDYAVRDITLDLFERITGAGEFADWRDVGIVIQAYLRDSRADLERMIALGRRRGLPFTVRLVKGAYWDYESVIAAQRGWPLPVFDRKSDSDANFEALTRLMTAAPDALDPAVASHNVRSLAHALACAQRLELPLGKLELQLLYGMGDPIKAALADRDLRVRVYAPFGELIPGMAYLIRRLLENTSNESFLRQGFVEHEAADRLLGDPASHPTAALHMTGRVPGDAGDFANAASTDFSKEASRMAVHQAIRDVRGLLGREYPLVIGGQEVRGRTVRPRENPANPAEVVGRVHQADPAAADRAVAAAAEAFPAWRDTPAADRAALLERLADALESHRHELAAWETLECGKQWREADADVSEAIDFCRYYGREAVRLTGEPRRWDAPGETNAHTYRPRGVGAIIAPWNFPLAILAGMSTAAVAAGNCVVLKPSGQSAVVAAQFMRHVRSAGFPPGVFNYLPGPGRQVGMHLVTHPGVDLVAFTGSLEVGAAIYAAAAAAGPGPRGVNFKHVVAEMGGKNAIVVDEDADPDDAIRGVIASAFGYNGQKCSACSRVIVVGPGYERFCRRLVEAARSLRVGPPEEPDTTVGPLIDREALERVRRYIEIGRREGCVLLETDVSHLGAGYYAGPTIIADVGPDARIAQEEIFGPVLAVMRAKDFDEALRLANGTRFALTGGLYSRSPRHVERARRELEAGNLYINRRITGALVGRQPFGGFRCSGLGSKAGGPDYLLQFLLPVTVTENTLRHGFAGDEG
ncbi:MAG: 1-pyrroline-5-carboxylate dehydrogenase [Phycisphaerae bacterium]|nr:1-pyrroline-5-carboxylate dehydrogenase [Phycisphaerae bacterium]